MTISVLGAYLQGFSKKFGLVNPLGGIIASDEAVKYLSEKSIQGYQLNVANVGFKKRTIEKGEKYFWIKPTYEIELDAQLGPGPKIQCIYCGRRGWNEADGLPVIKHLPTEGDIFTIKYTWVVLVTERFVKVVTKDVPNGCYLNFAPWEYTLFN